MIVAKRTVTVLGATRNFFKVGHYTLRRLAAEAPDLTLRLAIPDAQIAGRAVDDIPVQLRNWEPGDADSLVAALLGTDTMLMVPPINRRVETGRMYLDAALKAGVRHIVCLGIQFRRGQCTMADEAAALEDLLEESGIDFEIVALPMFLENLLYQCQSVTEHGSFTFPVGADRLFSYISCDDAAALLCRKILAPDAVDFSGALISHHEQATCEQWARALEAATGRPITFYRQDEEHFFASLGRYGMPRSAAAEVLGLWNLIGTEGDTAPTRAAEQLLGRPTTDLETWAMDHSCCFRSGFEFCPHPHPPLQHMFGRA